VVYSRIFRSVFNVAVMKKCSRCHQSHGPPRGKKCQRQLPEEPANDLPPPPEEGAEEEPVLDPSPTPPDEAQVFQAVTAETLAQILAAIKVFGDRLDTLEAPAKVPVPAPVDGDLDIQVRDRMNNLQLGQDFDSEEEWEPAGAGAACAPRGKLSAGKPDVSGETKTAKDNCRVRQEWPQYYVFRGAGREAATYNDLTIQEFVMGFLSIVARSRAGQRVRELMYRHLQELMLDATRAPWPSVRHYHAIVLHHMEIGELTWEDTAAIQELRANYALQVQCQPMLQGQGGGHPASQPSSPGIRYCGPFQTGTCKQPGDHETNRGFVLHICSYCLRKGKGQFPHGEQDCRWKRNDTDPKSDPKNEQ
jgi:hypothetical protein